MRREENGITLIALIITIIILVILAAVSVRAVYEMGIVNHAINGTQKYAQEAVKENKMLGDTEALIRDTIGKINNIQNGTGSPVPDITKNEWKFSNSAFPGAEAPNWGFDNNGNVYTTDDGQSFGTYTLQGNNLAITFAGNEEATTFEWDGEKFIANIEDSVITLTEIIPVVDMTKHKWKMTDSTEEWEDIYIFNTDGTVVIEGAPNVGTYSLLGESLSIRMIRTSTYEWDGEKFVDNLDEPTITLTETHIASDSQSLIINIEGSDETVTINFNDTVTTWKGFVDSNFSSEEWSYDEGKSSAVIYGSATLYTLWMNNSVVDPDDSINTTATYTLK